MTEETKATCMVITKASLIFSFELMKLSLQVNVIRHCTQMKYFRNLEFNL